ncbi:mandelate racemase muconate lactonizing protein [Leptolyngbya sp. Heron Island J]|uniref:mandelate racemase/muconate lactonizing enzyme family protein n=1 Tax=Leptolyngbya sp. Heron Island J TaxID=1385935 RepID=UPI0003B99695|nr:dipeptide epimerase [Leptolyngbya sp. Heron Island J]ESA33008.1 mandelate racemase muconate lactonizing protein [Leptolyngbya sp. Heron Island J]
MEITYHPITVHKKVPLTISRGTNTQSTNLFIQITADNITGYGEATPFSIGDQTQTTETITHSLDQIIEGISFYHPLDRQIIEESLDQIAPCSAARAAIDVALWDWLGKKVGLPLWQLWGLDCQRIGPTAVTIGINSPDGACDRIRRWHTDYPDLRSIKIKLGSPAGIDADQAMFSALETEFRPHDKISIDANGGWTLDDAKTMATWLADRNVTYLEQPLPVSANHHLAALKHHSPLPIFIDESCFTSRDIMPLAQHIDGINIKLMKSGGLTEARRMIHTARACGLGVMFGCYSDSALSNTALAQLSPLANHLDLDSHLNLKDDPFIGAQLELGRLIPSEKIGLGVEYLSP